MIVKYKSYKKNKLFDGLCIKLQRKGKRFYPLYNIVIMHKKSRMRNYRTLDHIGLYNPNYNSRIFFFDSVKLYFWIQKGAIINSQLKYYLIKFLV